MDLPNAGNTLCLVGRRARAGYVSMEHLRPMRADAAAIWDEAS